MKCPKCQAKTRVTTTLRSFRDHVRRYRKCPKCGHKLVTRQGFEEITASVAIYGRPGRVGPRAKLTVEDVRKIRAAAAEGKTAFECSLECDCEITVCTAYKVIKRKTWAWVE